ncbi:hypothetical protein ACL03H_14060 [Saccharopolyspora sp. MS10]|uniref:hypothetical protein n=1 Tax=Saccharopolyspora sp. MS10 TaxID=3385973 RepID=UPI00399F25B6
MPTSENSTENQSGPALNEAAEQARTPLLAALGAGDLAAQTIADTLAKLRTRLNDSASGVSELPHDLKERFDPAELRKRVDAYTQSAVQLYGYLAERGETTFERLQSQPQVQQAWSQLDSAVGDARGLADDVLGKVTRTTRSWGEKAAETTQHASTAAAGKVRETAADVADTVEQAGGEAATATRSTSRKAANRTAAAKSTAAKPKTGGTAAKGAAKPKSTGGAES